MSFALIQGLAIAIVVGTLAWMTVQRGRGVLREYAAVAAAGWLAENAAIRLYGHYAYADGWWLHVDQVPLLIALIWPLVILSARDVANALGASRPSARAALVFVVVLIDASLVEVIAVARGLWTWREPGYLGVPVIGIFGWAYFAVAVSWGFDHLKAWAVVLVAPLLTHALLVATWWGGFRWDLRADLGPAGTATALALAVIVCVQLVRARAWASVPLAVMAPRMVAAGLFVAIWISLGPSAALTWHLVAVAAPYLLVTGWIHRERP